jgi:hypothetical protein
MIERTPIQGLYFIYKGKVKSFENEEFKEQIVRLTKKAAFGRL